MTRDEAIASLDESVVRIVTAYSKLGIVGAFVRDLVEAIKAWQAFGKTANEHREKVGELSRGD